MSSIHLVKSDADEVTHLFKVMKKYNANCALKIEMKEQPYFYNTYHGTFNDFDLSNESDIHISFEEAEMLFEAKRFSTHVTDGRIYVSIVSQDFKALFRSSVMPPEAIEEANRLELTSK